MFQIREIKGRNVIYLCLGYLVWSVCLFNFGFYPRLGQLSGNMELPEAKFGLAGSYFYTFLGVIGGEGRDQYFYFQILDYLNGFLLALLLFVTIYYFLGKFDRPKFFAGGLLIPSVLLGLTDLLENTFIIYLLGAFPAQSAITARTLGYLTALKLAFGGLAFFGVFIIMTAYWIKIIIGRLRK